MTASLHHMQFYRMVEPLEKTHITSKFGNGQVFVRMRNARNSVSKSLSSHARRLLVLIQIALQRERLATSTAHVWLVRGVGLDVCSKV